MSSHLLDSITNPQSNENLDEEINGHCNNNEPQDNVISKLKQLKERINQSKIKTELEMNDAQPQRLFKASYLKYITNNKFSNIIGMIENHPINEKTYTIRHNPIHLAEFRIVSQMRNNQNSSRNIFQKIQEISNHISPLKDQLTKLKTRYYNNSKKDYYMQYNSCIVNNIKSHSQTNIFRSISPRNQLIQNNIKVEHSKDYYQNELNNFSKRLFNKTQMAFKQRGDFYFNKKRTNVYY